MILLRRRRTTFTLYGVRRIDQNQAFDEEIGKKPEQLPFKQNYVSVGGQRVQQIRSKSFN
jgi:hypothetical protein